MNIKGYLERMRDIIRRSERPRYKITVPSEPIVYGRTNKKIEPKYNGSKKLSIKRVYRNNN